MERKCPMAFFIVITAGGNIGIDMIILIMRLYGRIETTIWKRKKYCYI